MIRHLDLGASIATQQNMLLEKLPGWSAELLEKKLKSLESKGITIILYKSSCDRTISLQRLSAVPTLDDKEKDLWVALRAFIAQ